ncbi:FAD-dependent oxidoreductase [Saccharibacillus alkalitolerans]|uniref:FAD-dependent oxidoreductase n=1 Tax=Saccharibacillus alkalitolerans TaxID=2705290 RepID=A0ABX0F4A9_9BACL|nr:FAD-dependent oxidoreductase [Saccharibacillus alkalitolerans]NGZ75320.1 FAD-dependent oxidoreductase [Saccharibacillus alkalitolerans]
MSKKVLIVGGVAGGASAAARLRRLDEHAEIIMFEKGPYISFANCGLPYYIGGSIAERERLLVQTPKGMADRFRIDVRTQSEVISVNPQSRTVQVQSRERGLYEESYDELILSPGARPIVPDLPGKDHPLIYTVRNIPDIDRIKEKVSSGTGQSAVVIGGGFIGVEMAENLKEAGLDVTLVEGNAQLLAPFDPELAAALAQEMEQHGVKLLFSQRVQGFRSLDRGIGVELADSRVLSADLVILAIGVTPDTAFLKPSGIELGARGHIMVNEALETNIPHIYAVGDAIEVRDYVHGGQTAVPLAGPANKQGRIVADRIAGLNSVYRGTMGTSVIKVFDMAGASTGSSEKTLKRLGVDYRSVIVHPSSHASYYPGASAIMLKLLFTPEGKVLGAQAVGYEGVEKRIDDIAVAIHFGGHVSDLTELELSYAPPFSSAKDPVNMAGYAAENIMAGRVRSFTYDQLDERIPENSVLLDVRSDLEHRGGHIPGSISIPVDELRGRLNELDPAKEIWAYCQVGLRGYTASQILRQHGFDVRNLSGGYKTYRQAQFKPAPLPGGDNDDNGGGGSKSLQPAAPIVKEHAVQTAEAQHAPSAPAAPSSIDRELDARGLSCPGPLMQVKQTMDRLEDGQTLRVQASDPGFYEDIAAWASMTGNALVQRERLAGGVIEAVIAKKAAANAAASALSTPSVPSLSADAPGTVPSGDSASTMVVFSGDLDKAIASLIIANGAAASGRKVTMFFTFWGLNIIRKNASPRVSKNRMGRMFDMMLPRGSRKLGLSQMNMFGAGPKMIRGLMKSHNVPSLEELLQSAIDQGVEIVACQMSMDLMGIKREELIAPVRSGGVGYYLGHAAQANHNLFV